MLPNFFLIKLLTFSFQICFRKKFRTLGKVKLKIRQLRQLAYFQFDHIPQSEIDSKTRFEIRMSIFQFNIFWSASNITKKCQKWISHCFFLIFLGQWEGVILEIPYGLLRVLSPFLSKKSRQVG